MGESAQGNETVVLLWGCLIFEYVTMLFYWKGRRPTLVRNYIRTNNEKKSSGNDHLSKCRDGMNFCRHHGKVTRRIGGQIWRNPVTRTNQICISPCFSTIFGLRCSKTHERSKSVGPPSVSAPPSMSSILGDPISAGVSALHLSYRRSCVYRCAIAFGMPIFRWSYA